MPVLAVSTDSNTSVGKMVAMKTFSVHWNDVLIVVLRDQGGTTLGITMMS